MSRSRRYGIFFLLISIVLLLGLIFRAFVLKNILVPTALMLWLLVRIFILSIDQRVWWGLLVIAVAVYGMRRLYTAPKSTASYLPYDINATLEAINYWQTFMRLAPFESGAQKIVKRDLARLVVAMYESRQRGAASFELHEAIQKRQIALPEEVYAFLFAPEPPRVRGRLAQAWQNWRRLPVAWWRRITHRDQVDYIRSVQTVFDFLETSLEMQHDDRNLE